MSEFDGFWKAYPRKVGKLAAMKAYQRARTIATAEEIAAGVELYRQHLPEDIRYVPHAATFLNQGRWMDEYEQLPVKIEPPKPQESKLTLALKRASNW